MGYTIKDFIDSNKFPGIQLISDNSGINREIKGTRIIVERGYKKNFWKGVNFFLHLSLFIKSLVRAG